MGLRNTYFSLDGLDPIAALDRFRHPYVHTRTVLLRGKDLTIRWTERAERALVARQRPLLVEMQIYFSCVVKKRVLFPNAPRPDLVQADERLLVCIRTVESDRCDPVTFAANYPARRELDSAAAKRMSARELLLDYRKSRWEGEFSL